MSRGKIRFAALISAIFVLFINICAFAKVDIPNHTDRFFINDYANVIDSETEDYIFEKGKAYNANGGPQVVVLTMESIDGNDLEDFSIETARKWGIGDKDADNGVLILLVMDSRDIRIEVGYGLEGVLNDGKCGRFIRNATDSLSAGDYSEGIKQIYDSVIGELEDPTPDEEDDDDTMVEIMTYVVFFIVLAIVVFITNIKGRGGRGGHGGGGGGSSSDLSSVSDTDLTKMMRDAGNRMDTASEIMQRTAHGATQYNQRMPESVFPEATKANYDKYRAASKAFRTARAQRDRISDEQIRRQPKSSGTSHAFVNSFGEATTREITNQNYQRSQKSLSKSVLRNMGY